MRSNSRCIRLVSLLVVCLAFSGCAGFSVVKGGERSTVGADMSVVPPNDWNKFTSPTIEFWTLDGPTLQHVRFVKGVKDGDIVYYLPPDPNNSGDDPNKGLPVYRKGMNPLEISELIEATLARNEAQRIMISGLKPDTFAGRDGFSFNFTYVSKDGLEMKGIAAGAIVDEHLYMAIYQGARIYYFDRGYRDFRKILDTARIGETSS